METSHLIIAGIGSVLVSIVTARFMAWQAWKRDSGDLLLSLIEQDVQRTHPIVSRTGKDGGRTFVTVPENVRIYNDQSGLGRIAYNAYCASTGGRSAVTGEKLPAWNDQGESIRLAWTRAAAAVSSAVTRR